MKNKIFRALKNIVCTVLFLSILLSCLCGFSYFFRYEEDEKSTLLVNGFYALEEESIDVLFIGGSGYYRSLSPPLLYEKTGLRSYDLCSPAYLFDATLTLIKEAEKTQQPSLYVVDIRRFYKELKKDISGENMVGKNLKKQKSRMSYIVNNMPLSLNRAQLIHKFYGEKLGVNEIEWQFDYLRTHNNWKEHSFSDFKEYMKKMLNANKPEKAPYNGVICGPWHTELEDIDVGSYKETLNLDYEALGVLNELMEYAKKGNIEILFMIPPYAVSEENYAYEKFIGDYIKASGFRFLNINEKIKEVGIDYKTDFYDENHLNALGCLKLTPYIADYITENYDIKKKEMTDAQKDEWEKMFAEWSALSEKYVRKIMKDCEKDNG